MESTKNNNHKPKQINLIQTSAISDDVRQTILCANIIN